MPHDHYDVADNIEDFVAEWDPDEATEPPTVIDDEGLADWIGRRLKAIRFRTEEMDELRMDYAAEVAPLQEEIDRLIARRDDIIAGLARDRRVIAHQLHQVHERHLAHAERRAEQGDRTPLPKMIRTPHGDLRSMTSSNAIVDIVDEDDAGTKPAALEQAVVDWLVAHDLTAGLRWVEPVAGHWKIDGRKLPGLVTEGDDGRLRIVDAKGEECPHLAIRPRPRSMWLVMPDGESSKNW